MLFLLLRLIEFNKTIFFFYLISYRKKIYRQIIDPLKNQGIGIILVNRIPIIFFLVTSPKIFFLPNFRNRLFYLYTCTKKPDLENFIPFRIERNRKYSSDTNSNSFQIQRIENLLDISNTVNITFYPAFDNQKKEISMSFKEPEQKNLSFFYSVVPLRDVFSWELRVSKKQKSREKKRELVNKNWNSESSNNLQEIKQKWYRCILVKSKKIWIKTFWLRFEKREILFRNSINWRERFKIYWKNYKGKTSTLNSNFIFWTSRKFRLNTHSKKPEIKFSNSFFLFSFKKVNKNKFNVKLYKRGLPFSKISFIPGVESKTFQKRIKINRKISLYPNSTNSERFIQESSSINFPGIWTFDLNSKEYISEPGLLFQESTRLFEKNKLRGSRINSYLINLTTRDVVEIRRREARWRIKTNRRWQDKPHVYSYARPYYRSYPSELVIGRRFHNFQGNYDFIFQKNIFSFLANSLISKWKKRKYIFLLSEDRKRSKFSNKYRNFHNFQINILLPSSSSPSFFSSNRHHYWRRWQISNLPILAKARKNWLETCDKRFTLNVRRCIFSAKCRSNVPWWRLMGPVIVDYQQKERNYNDKFWYYSTTFFPRCETNFFKLKKDKKRSVFFASLLKLYSDQRTYSLIWIKKVKSFFPSDYLVWLSQDIYSIILVPCTFFFLFRIQNFLFNSFNSVKKDFSYALYQIVKRGGGNEIESEWIEWLLNTIGISQQNAGIRRYTRNSEDQIIIENIVGFDKEISIFFNLLFYLRMCKWNIKFFYLKKKHQKFWFGGFRPSAILLVGPPGTGKTIIVRSLGNESQVDVVYQCLGIFTDFTVSGFGRTVSSKAIQLGFGEAWSRIPAIFFLDEIDALRMNRRNLIFKSKGVGFIHPNFCKRRQLTKKIKIVKFSINSHKQSSGDQILGLRQLLIEVDNRIKNDGLVLIGATNRPIVLDSRLIRPGRFNQIISFNLPNKKKREAILKISLNSFLGANLSTTNKIWGNFLTQLKGKSPAYISSLRNIAFLHYICLKSSISIEKRLEYTWNRIEDKVKKNRITYSKKKNNQEIYSVAKLKEFLRVEYKNRISFFFNKQRIKTFWNKNFFVPGKKIFFGLFKEKENQMNFCYSLFFIKNVLQTTTKFRTPEIEKQNLYMIKGKINYEKMRKISIFHFRKLQKEEYVNFYSYLWFLIEESKNNNKWQGQWYHFEISESANLHTFSWVPPDEHIIQKIFEVSFKEFKFSNLSETYFPSNRKTDYLRILFHQSRGKLDLRVSKILWNL